MLFPHPAHLAALGRYPYPMIPVSASGVGGGPAAHLSAFSPATSSESGVRSALDESRSFSNEDVDDEDLFDDITPPDSPELDPVGDDWRFL